MNFTRKNFETVIIHIPVGSYEMELSSILAPVRVAFGLYLQVPLKLLN